MIGRRLLFAETIIIYHITNKFLVDVPVSTDQNPPLIKDKTPYLELVLFSENER